MALSLSTEDKLEYKFYPVQGSQIQFRVKAPNDAHIALTTGPFEENPMLEVFIGGWKNSKSVIRKNRTKPDVTEAETPNILSGDEHRGFWIRWYEGVITVGKENDPEAFLTFQDPEPFEISNFGICTGWGASGEWLIEERCIYGDDGVSGEDMPPEYQSCAWIAASNGKVPSNAVVGGHDDVPIYICQVEHQGNTIPGKVKPDHGCCYIGFDGKELSKTEYKVLCNCNATWVPTTGNNIPPNAVAGGMIETGETLYIGRVNYENTLTLGKVHPSHNCLYIPYNGEEISFTEYEILTC